MTQHYLVCTKCGHNIPGSSREELTAEPRRCPCCDSGSWEIVDGPLFPCKIREREILYMKILHTIRWCEENTQPCRTHPGCCPLSAHHCIESANIPGALYDWIMSTELKKEEK